MEIDRQGGMDWPDHCRCPIRQPGDRKYPYSTKAQTERHRLEDSPRGVHEPAQQTPIANYRRATPAAEFPFANFSVIATLVGTYCAVTWTMSRTLRRDRTGYHRASLAGTRSEAQSNVARLANYLCLGAVNKVMESIWQFGRFNRIRWLGGRAGRNAWYKHHVCCTGSRLYWFSTSQSFAC